MRHTQQAFTLIEIMLVLALLGILMGLFAANLSPSPQQQLRFEAKRLQAVLQEASDEAVMQGVELALALPEHAYQILQFDNQSLRWLSSNDKPFSLYNLPDNIQLEISLADESYSEHERQQILQLKKQQGDFDAPPLVLFLSSGEISPFSLTMNMKENNAKVSLSYDGFSGIVIDEG